MAIEVLEDIIEDLANQIGINGACVEQVNDCECRGCWTSDLTRRIREAIKVEDALSAAQQRDRRRHTRLAIVSNSNPSV